MQRKLRAGDVAKALGLDSATDSDSTDDATDHEELKVGAVRTPSAASPVRRVSRLLAIDPGPTESALVWYDTERARPVDLMKVDNQVVLDVLTQGHRRRGPHVVDHVALEMIASYGMPVGAEVFETCVWIGRFEQAWSGPRSRVFRKDVKLTLCQSPRAKDSNVRAALVDRWGGKSAIGTKKQPGPLYGFAKDTWAALGVAVTWCEANAA